MAGSEVTADLWVSEYLTPLAIYAHGVTKVLAYKQTAYQEMYIVEAGAYGKALVLDGKWQSCVSDEFIYHEALVHPAAIACQSLRRVLILGGGEGATAREVLRWRSVEQAVMVDIDAEVVDACREHLAEMHQGAFDDPRLEVKIADATHVLDQSDREWDLIISDLTDPIESGPSFALFTKEYFQTLQRALAPGGCVVVQAGPVEPVRLSLHARLANTLAAVFPHTLAYCAPLATYGSPWGFVLASEEAIATRPDPEEIDRRLAAEMTSELRFLDGTALLGLLQAPAYIRRAIAAETEVYSLENPPKFFGTGVAGSSGS